MRHACAVSGCVAAFWVLQEYFLHKALHSDFDWFGMVICHAMALAFSMLDSQLLTKAESVAGRAIHLEHHQMPFYHISLGEKSSSSWCSDWLSGSAWPAQL